MLEFQSTPPRGGRQTAADQMAARLGGDYGLESDRFNPRPRVGGDSMRITCAGLPGADSFNPRPRVGGDRQAFCYLRIDTDTSVSIHAPAWGATAHACALGLDLSRVSIHAPAWGATSDRGAVLSARTPGFNPRPRVGGDTTGRQRQHVLLLDRFQSTPPRGGRLLRAVASTMSRRVSIHAPAWGATSES